MMIDDHPQHYDDHYRPLHHDHHCSERDDQFSFDLWKNLSGPLNPPTLWSLSTSPTFYEVQLVLIYCNLSAALHQIQKQRAQQ